MLNNIIVAHYVGKINDTYLEEFDANIDLLNMLQNGAHFVPAPEYVGYSRTDLLFEIESLAYKLDVGMEEMYYFKECDAVIVQPTAAKVAKAWAEHTGEEDVQAIVFDGVGDGREVKVWVEDSAPEYFLITRVTGY